MSVLLYGSTTCTLTKRLDKKLHDYYTRMLHVLLGSNPGRSTPQDNNCTATYLPSHKPSKKDGPEMLESVGEVLGTQCGSSWQQWSSLMCMLAIAFPLHIYRALIYMCRSQHLLLGFIAKYIANETYIGLFLLMLWYGCPWKIKFHVKSRRKRGGNICRSFFFYRLLVSNRFLID